MTHGWFHDSQMWNMNIDMLAQKFRIYEIDFWGFGYSTRKMMDWKYKEEEKHKEEFEWATQE